MSNNIDLENGDYAVLVRAWDGEVGAVKVVPGGPYGTLVRGWTGELIYVTPPRCEESSSSSSSSTPASSSSSAGPIYVDDCEECPGSTGDWSAPWTNHGTLEDCMSVAAVRCPGEYTGGVVGACDATFGTEWIGCYYCLYNGDFYKLTCCCESPF